MTDNRIDYEAIRERVKKRVAKRAEFFIHLGAYVIVNVVLLLIWLAIRADVFTVPTSSDLHDVFQIFKDVPIPLLVAGGWLIALLIHGFTVVLETGLLDRMRESEFQREIEREQRRLNALEKPKRDEGRLVLTDDGEVISEEERISRSNTLR